MSGGQALLLGGAALTASFFISLLLTPIVRRMALRRGFVDHPKRESHKAHPRTVAFGGGVAITAAIVLPMLGVIALSFISPSLSGEGSEGLSPNWSAWMGGVRLKAGTGVAILLGALVLHAMGLMDDRRSLGAMTKLIIQAAVALILTVGFEIRVVEAFVGTIPAAILTALWIVTLTNAFNFLDNMDGLSGGVAFLASVILAATAFRAGQIFVPCSLMLVAGAVLGFLMFNFPPASIFMGDAGSLVIGYFLAVFTVLTTFYDPEQGRTPFGVLVPVVVFAIPLYDLLSVTWHRYRSGRSIFSADRGHFSHRLVQLGMSPTSAVLTIYLATLATALPAMLLPQLGWTGAVLVGGQCVCIVSIIAILESRHGR